MKRVVFAALVSLFFTASLEARQKDTKKTERGLPAGVSATRDIEYAVINDKRLLLDVFVPEKKSEKPAPAVIWIHGGGWESGSKDQCPAALLVPHGYVAVSISYRFTSVAPYPAQIQDCKAAVRWVRAHAKDYNIDPDRIGVWGASAGGQLVALLGTTSGDKELEGDVGGNLDQSSKVQAVCDWFGPTDFYKLCRMAAGESAEDASKPMAKAKDEKGEEKERKIATPSPVRKLFAGDIQDKLALAATANPITYVDKDDAPFLILHGDQDKIVPLDQSEILKASLEKAGVSAKLHVVKGGGHGFWSDDILKMVREFFDDKLKNEQAPALSK